MNVYNKQQLLKLLYKYNITLAQIDLSQNPKCFWYYIKNLKSDNDVPNTMIFDDKSSTGGSEAAIIFKDCFSSVYSDLNLIMNSCLNYSKHFTDKCNQPFKKIST